MCDLLDAHRDIVILLLLHGHPVQSRVADHFGR